MTQRGECETRLQQIAHEISTTQRAKEKAFWELGECEHRDVTLQVELAQAAIKEKERELAEAKSALAAVIDEGVERLGQ